MDRDGPSEPVLEKQDEHIQCLPGFHFPVRASRVKTVEIGLSAASADRGAVRNRHSDSNDEDDDVPLDTKALQEKLKVVRIMINVAYMR